MPTDDEVRRLFEEEAAKARERVQLAVERGGPPADDDASALFDHLNKAYECVEQLTWRIEGVSEADGLPEGEQPFELTLENIGVLAVMADDVQMHIEELQTFERKLRRAVGTFDAIRRTQQVRSSH